MPATPSTPLPITGVVQHYPWGDTEFIPDLLGVAPTGEPWAELWLGTHPAGASTLGDGTPLVDVSGPLPYLLKVLAAAEPLSLQAHPSEQQADDGHRRGVYDDATAKPELLVALTPVEAFCGFRPAARTVALLHDVGATELAAAVERDGIDHTLRGLYRGDVDAAAAVAACTESSLPEAVWVRRLDAGHPDDRSVAVTLLLNYVVLRPGESLHLTAGNLHAYLSGAGVELMRASDNVVRGGLTSKPVDVDELLRIVDTTPLDEPVAADAARTGRYPLPEAGVELVRLEPGSTHVARGHELTVSMDGATHYLAAGVEFTATAETFVVTPLIA